MKSIQFVLLALLVFTFTVNCNSSEQMEAISTLEQPVSAYTDITQSEFQSMKTDLPEDVVILDVRTDEEVAEGMIDGAIQVDYRNANFRNQIALLDTSKTYIVYCRSGGRSSAASKMMTEELGFKKVKNLLGGYSNYSPEN